MTNFKTPLRGQQELTLLGSEKTTSSLVVFILAFLAKSLTLMSRQDYNRGTEICFLEVAVYGARTSVKKREKAKKA